MTEIEYSEKDFKIKVSKASGLTSTGKITPNVEVSTSKGKNEKEIVAASDAFFPFVDGIEKLIQSGVSAVIQPRGSIRDKEIIKFADKTNTILIFSKTRHFRH